MAHMQISTETSTWLLQAKDFLVEVRRLKPGPARNEVRQVAKVLRELGKLEAQPESALDFWSAGENLIGRSRFRIRQLHWKGRWGFSGTTASVDNFWQYMRSIRPRGNGSHCIARFIYCIRHNQNARSGRICRKDLCDFETHVAVAFAGRRREPRSVDLNLASSI